MNIIYGYVLVSRMYMYMMKRETSLREFLSGFCLVLRLPICDNESSVPVYENSCLVFVCFFACLCTIMRVQYQSTRNLVWVLSGSSLSYMR